MSTITNVLHAEEIVRHGYDESRNRYIVVHPLDDAPEEKIDTETLGAMTMTRSVKWSLISLRAYLVLMLLLVGYRVLEIAGLFGGR
jgi:hypothetical protein